MKNKFLLGLLALSTLGLANVFEAKAEVKEDISKGGKVFTNTAGVQKNKLEVKLNDTFTVTGKLEHNFTSVNGDTGLAVKADLKELGTVELTTFLAPKASLGYTYKTDAYGLKFEGMAKFTEQKKFTDNNLEAGLKVKKVFDSQLNVLGKTKVSYNLKEMVTPEAGVEVEYKPVMGLTLKSDLNAKFPVKVAKAATSATVEFTAKNKASYDVMLDSNLKVTPMAEVNYKLNSDVAKDATVTHTLDLIPAVAAEYKMGSVTLNGRASADVNLSGTKAAFGYVKVTPKLETGLKYVW